LQAAGIYICLGFGFGVLGLKCFFSWNNGLREAVVRVVFVFEHFFYSSATAIL
jgi:hypothetical protein